MIDVPYKDSLAQWAMSFLLYCHKPKIIGNMCYDIKCCLYKKRDNKIGRYIFKFLLNLFLFYLLKTFVMAK